MKPKAQFGPLIRTDIGPGPFTDISVKDQVWDHMVHRHEVDHKAPISETFIHRIRYRRWTNGPIEPDIGPKEQTVRRTAGTVPRPTAPPGNEPFSEPSDIGRASDPFIQFLQAGSFPFHITIEPISRQWPIGSGNNLHLSAAALFAVILLSYSGTDTKR